MPTDPTYDEDRQESNPAFQADPALVVYCMVPQDVRLCLRAANHLGLWVALRSGGQSTACYSVNDGMVIDVSHLNSVTVDKDRMTAVVAPGPNFGDLNAHLDTHKVHNPGGACQDVCVAGYMQGGGFGYTSRKFGMNCDNVLAVTVMLWDGTLVRADDKLNRDLF